MINSMIVIDDVDVASTENLDDDPVINYMGYYD